MAAVVSKYLQAEMQQKLEELQREEKRIYEELLSTAGHTTPQATAAKYAKAVKGAHPQRTWPTAHVVNELTISKIPATSPLEVMASCEPEDFQDRYSSFLTQPLYNPGFRITTGNATNTI